MAASCNGEADKELTEWQFFFREDLSFFLVRIFETRFDLLLLWLMSNGVST